MGRRDASATYDQVIQHIRQTRQAMYTSSQPGLYNKLAIRQALTHSRPATSIDTCGNRSPSTTTHSRSTWGAMCSTEMTERYHQSPKPHAFRQVYRHVHRQVHFRIPACMQTCLRPVLPTAVKLSPRHSNILGTHLKLKCCVMHH